MAKITSLAEGLLDGEHVVVRDVAQANRLHNKAVAGTPQPGNTLRLTRVEAAYCLAMGWLEVVDTNKRAVPFAALLATPPSAHRVDVDYFVYRDLRERGFVARPTRAGQFEVLPRGVAQGPAAFHILACADSDPVSGSALLGAAAAKTIVAVVDGDGAITHYTQELANPTGTVPPTPLPRARGWLLADRVLLLDEAARKACAAQHLGNAQGHGTFLSLLEAATLVEQGHLDLDDAAAFANALASNLNPVVLAVNQALRQQGVVAKSGFRFGTHLRGYPANPDDEHAPWLIHCTDATANLGWSTLSRGVRLAHGVRKEFLVGIVTGSADRGSASGPVQFVRLAWFRP